MKRTNIHLEESQIEGIAKRAEVEKMLPAQMVRKAIDFYLSLSEPTGPMADVEFVRQKMIEKRGGADVDYREVLRELAYEKAVEYRNKQNNFARITTLVEEVKRLTRSIEKLLEVNNVRPDDN
jgi:hypothetical protein